MRFEQQKEKKRGFGSFPPIFGKKGERDSLGCTKKNSKIQQEKKKRGGRFTPATIGKKKVKGKKGFGPKPRRGGNLGIG